MGSIIGYGHDRDAGLEEAPKPKPHVSSIDKINALMLAFPCLARKDPPKFAAGGSCNPFVKWAKGNCYSHGEMLAAQFVVLVWTGSDKACGLRSFKLAEALGVWDDGNRRAFVDFCRAPFWP